MAEGHPSFFKLAATHRNPPNWLSTITKSGSFAGSHRTDYFIHFAVLGREKVGEMSKLPSSSSSGCALIFAVAHPARTPWTASPSSLLRPSPAFPRPPSSRPALPPTPRRRRPGTRPHLGCPSRSVRLTRRWPLGLCPACHAGPTTRSRGLAPRALHAAMRHPPVAAPPSG